MAYFTDLNKGSRRQIHDSDYTDDPGMESIWQSTLAKTPQFDKAVSEHLSNVGQLPISVKKQVEQDSVLKQPTS